MIFSHNNHHYMYVFIKTTNNSNYVKVNEYTYLSKILTLIIFKMEESKKV